MRSRASIEVREGIIQIGAESLRREQDSVNKGWKGFTLMTDPCDTHPDAKAPSKPRWRQSDLKRAISAAEEAGLRSYRVDIATDGTISIIVGLTSEPLAQVEPGETPAA
jgi:hypothetical protein